MEEIEAWIWGIWETVKDSLTQRILTWHLPLPPFLSPGQLSGLNVIVTGCTNGIGLYTARELVMAGAHVTMACRNVEAANRIADGWREEVCGSKTIHVEIMSLDLLSLSSVRSFADKWKQREMPLHALINNAGAFYMREPQRFTEDGIEQHMQVNHVAPALLTLLLLPSLLKAPSSHIINVNSMAHHCAIINPSSWTNRIDADKFNALRSYGESKLAQLMFLKTLAHKLTQLDITSVQCIAVNPGVVKTNIVKYPLTNWKMLWMWMLNPAEGARSVLFPLTDAKVAQNLTKGFAYYSWLCAPARVALQANNDDSCLSVWRKTTEILALDVDYLLQLIER